MSFPRKRYSKQFCVLIKSGTNTEFATPIPPNAFPFPPLLQRSKRKDGCQPWYHTLILNIKKPIIIKTSLPRRLNPS